jgi:hypothetical protein
MTFAMVKNEFGQKVSMHIHGDMKKPKYYAFLEKLVVNILEWKETKDV